MTETMDPVAKTARSEHQQLATELVERARADGIELIGPGGLLVGC